MEKKSPDPPPSGNQSHPIVSAQLDNQRDPQIDDSGQDNQKRSFAEAVRGTSFVADSIQPTLNQRFPAIKLPNRQYARKDGKPCVSFTASEIQAGAKRFEHTLIAKFTFGRPPIAEIRQFFSKHWRITGQATITHIWDARHVLIILDNEDDVTAALTASARKIGHALFRLFRWSPDYNPKKESTVVTAWVKLPGLPLVLYDAAYIELILSSFCDFLDVDDKTKALVEPNYARACVEIDVTQRLPNSVWIAMGNSGYWQSIVFEGNLTYCSKCNIHGHSLDTCRKQQNRKPAPTKEKGINGNHHRTIADELNMGEKLMMASKPVEIHKEKGSLSESLETILETGFIEGSQDQENKGQSVTTKEKPQTETQATETQTTEVEQSIDDTQNNKELSKEVGWTLVRGKKATRNLKFANSKIQVARFKKKDQKDSKDDNVHNSPKGNNLQIVPYSTQSGNLFPKFNDV